jgi:hypothetical protein
MLSAWVLQNEGFTGHEGHAKERIVAIGSGEAGDLTRMHTLRFL